LVLPGTTAAVRLALRVVRLLAAWSAAHLGQGRLSARAQQARAAQSPEVKPVAQRVLSLAASLGMRLARRYAQRTTPKNVKRF
jgi:hypothetical protein